MVASPKASGLRRRLWLRAAALQLGAFALCLAAEPPLSLTPREVGAREPPDFAPLYAGRNVIVRGVVSAPFFNFPGYALLPFEDARYGTVLEVLGDGHELESFHQGDEIEVQGVVSSHAGMVTIRPEQIRGLAHQTPPTPETVPPEAIQDFRHLGRALRTQARITEIGETTAGAYLSLATAKGEFRLLIPHGRGVRSASLAEYSVGDKIEATGVALQYCTTPPYDRWFELLVSNPRYITRTEKARSVPLAAIVAGVASLMLLGLVLWTRERRLRSQREHLRLTYQLGEQILGASSSEAIVAEIAQGMPALLGISRVNMYVYNRATKALDAISPGGNEVLSVSLSEPPGGTHAGVVACFHYKTLLAIPDIGRSPFPIAAPQGKTRPKSLMFVPMLAQGEVIGVLELDRDDRTHDFTADEQTLAQHLANQVGVAVRLLDQRSVQEQLFRTEKLAAVGRLISGVVNQLLTPLASISELADSALVKSRLTPAERDVLAIAAEAQKASSIVARLVSFATAEQGEARPVAVTTLIRNLIEFRERDWKASGIRVSDLTSPEPMFVLGSYGQLEQAFLTLFVYAEQSLVDVPQRSITIRTSPLGRRLLVEIGFSAPPDRRAPQETAAVLGVTRSVIAGHGGEVRLVEKNNAEPRFEVELPLTARDRGGIASPASLSPREGGRHATALLIEAEEAQQKQLLDLLAAQGYRVVPVSNADTGFELAQRMRFEAAFCSLHAPGLNWVELSERLQTRVGAFVLLSDRYDAELATDFEGDGRFVLNKPVQEADLARILSAIESSAPDSTTKPAVEPGSRGPERGKSPKPS
jgi:GAF domain-containing protein/CheY-like chemotaxis protein